MPTKNELWSAHVAHIVQAAAIAAPSIGEVSTNMAQRSRAASRRWSSVRSVCTCKAYQDSGAELIMGSGRFVGPKTLESS